MTRAKCLKHARRARTLRGKTRTSCDFAHTINHSKILMRSSNKKSCFLMKNPKSTFDQHVGNICCLNVALKVPILKKSEKRLNYRQYKEKIIILSPIVKMYRTTNMGLMKKSSGNAVTKVLKNLYINFFQIFRKHLLLFFYLYEYHILWSHTAKFFYCSTIAALPTLFSFSNMNFRKC